MSEDRDLWYEDEIKAVLNQTLFSKQELIEKFGWVEYFIFALMLAISAGIGIYFWKKGQYGLIVYFCVFP